MSETLLPDNATPQEIALDMATARLGDVPVDIRTVMTPSDCPAPLLPWLAWALSVDEWDAAWTEETKRVAIAASIGVHQRKGTRAAVRAAIDAAGYGDADIIEQFGLDFHNGQFLHNGTITYAEPDHWAEYRLGLARPITIAQAAQVRRIAEAVHPLRSRLKLLTYEAAQHLYDGTITNDGTFAHGAA
jgi:phage tail P2-like protein